MVSWPIPVTVQFSNNKLVYLKQTPNYNFKPTRVYDLELQKITFQSLQEHLTY